MVVCYLKDVRVVAQELVLKRIFLNVLWTQPADKIFIITKVLMVQSGTGNDEVVAKVFDGVLIYPMLEACWANVHLLVGIIVVVVVDLHLRIVPNMDRTKVVVELVKQGSRVGVHSTFMAFIEDLV